MSAAAAAADGRPPPGVRLCALEELTDPGARGFVFEPGEGGWNPFRGLVVRDGGEVRGFVDSCPHTGAPLSDDPQRYLTRKGDFLVCWNHGALFRPGDGVCVAGPCVKRALRPWAVRVRSGEVLTA